MFLCLWKSYYAQTTLSLDHCLAVNRAHCAWVNNPSNGDLMGAPVLMCCVLNGDVSHWQVASQSLLRLEKCPAWRPINRAMLSRATVVLAVLHSVMALTVNRARLWLWLAWQQSAYIAFDTPVKTCSLVRMLRVTLCLHFNTMNDNLKQGQSAKW